jgi:hypothetical protein
MIKLLSVACTMLITFFCFLNSGIAHAHSEQFVPQEIVTIIKQHAVWQSITLGGLPSTAGAFSVVLPHISKKWLVDGEKLKERTVLSIETDCSEITVPNPDLSKVFKWSSSEIDFASPVKESDLFLDAEQALKQCQGADSRPIHFKKIDSNRFEVSVDGSTNRVIFFPEIRSDRFKSELSGVPNNIWRAPLGSLRESLLKVYQLPTVADTAYLHHDLSSKKPVFLDKDFPDKFIPILSRVIQKWNKALGRDLFVLQKQRTITDEVDCYASEKICVRWYGSSNIAWSKLSCFATPSFDPETGKIIGGLLQCRNEATAIQPSPPEVLDFYRRYPFNIDWVASAFLKREEFSKYEHPEPEKVLTYFFLHEFGHLNGLGHNLMGSVMAAPKDISKSIMDYPPFPVMSKAGHFGKFDFEILSLIYKRIPVQKDFEYCGDSDSERLMAKIAGVQKQPACNKFDFGNPVEWFIALARNGSQGIWTQDPVSSDTAFISLSDFLNLDLNATLEQRSLVKSYFCSIQSDFEIVNLLSKLVGVTIQCATKQPSLVGGN